MSDGYSGTGSFADSNTAVISAACSLLLTWAIVEPIYLFSIGSPMLVEPRYMVGFVTVVPSCLGMIYGARWLRESEIPAIHHSKIRAYWLIGGIGFLVFNGSLMAFFPTNSLWIVLNWIRWALSFGLAIGLVIGIAQARAIFSTISAERQSIRAEHVEKQRDLIDQMNGILRHEVLNAVQVITGNASLLLQSDEPIEPTDERVRRIHRQGEEITNVIQEVRLLLSTIQDDRELKRTNLTSVIETEIQNTRDQSPSVEIDLRCQEEIHIQADELLGRIFANVFRNSVEHNDTTSLQITVDVERNAGSVDVTIEDNGDGIPEHKLATLFDRPQVSDHGLGLYLVKELTNSYGGTIELLRTGEDGTAFRFRFPVSESPQ